uniref:WxxW domain-containing protein n=1 Tax=Oryzias latipes TaxID=8090 RepID=A0A3P9I653_ORYLA
MKRVFECRSLGKNVKRRLYEGVVVPAALYGAETWSLKVVEKRKTFLPDCWTQWFDRDDPSGTGDWETLSDLLKQYPNEICPNPVDVEATTLSGTPAKQTGEVFYKYDKTSGFVCRNEDQKQGMCKDYRVRFSCPSAYCSEKDCWTQWFDRDDPSGTGDWETLSDLLKQYPNEICPNPVDVEATTLSGTPANQTGEVFHKYDKTSGFVCRNEDQKEGMCKDYRVRFSCPSWSPSHGSRMEWNPPLGFNCTLDM